MAPCRMFSSHRETPCELISTHLRSHPPQALGATYLLSVSLNLPTGDIVYTSVVASSLSLMFSGLVAMAAGLVLLSSPVWIVAPFAH